MLPQLHTASGSLPSQSPGQSNLQEDKTKRAISHHSPPQREDKMGPKQMNICASASHHASVTCAGSAGALLTHQESQWLLQPPLTHLLHFTAKSPLRSSKVSLFSLFSLFCEDLPTFNKPVTNEKCHCPRFPHGAFSCFQLSKRWDYEAGHGLFAGPSGVDRERISTIRS